MKNFANILIDKSVEIINSTEFLNQSRISTKSFTRERKMGFKKIILFCLNLVKKSIQLELDSFAELLDEEVENPISKQGFSKARQNISPKAFETLFLMTAKESLNNKDFHHFKGYRVLAIDGTEIELSRSNELSEKFPPSRNTTAPRARVSILCDVLNNCIIHAEIESLAVGERAMAKKHMNFYRNNKTIKTNELIIFDRGYPSKELIRELASNNIKFLMRLQKSFSAEIDKSTKKDFYIDVIKDQSITKVRVIKLILENGVEETLITNLGRNKFKHDEFAQLYFLRWGVETKYNSIKNKLQIEEFTGKTIISVLQDFYATLYLSNIASAFKFESDKQITGIDQPKVLKHNYKTNESFIIGKLKNNLVLILLCNDPDDRALLLDKLFQRIIKAKVSSIPGRHFIRPTEAHKKTRSKIKRVI